MLLRRFRQNFLRRLSEIRSPPLNSDRTQAQIAEFLGCQREVYRRYEKGTRQIPVDMLIQLSRLYNVSIDYLVGLTNEKKPYPRRK
ncbi:helix-turn-helix transcriptional regulator [Mediterraneibacter sp. NSJ-55]|uniref:Helix-turn-helix transcriptional regulator n=1 Tax=Mediterraneibacter hominis TaxID=2763054 RepID=A0A923LGB2_9FIRM|nr:helix-turn-helix transcriptional regulator [Mediterraneibacter hominis]